MKVFSLAIILSLLSISCLHQTDHGKTLYHQHCYNCHGTNGEGLKGHIPDLANSSKISLEKIPCIIKHGIEDSKGNERTVSMPKNLALTDVEITNLTNYILSKYAQKESVTILQVQEHLEKCN